MPRAVARAVDQTSEEGSREWSHILPKYFDPDLGGWLEGRSDPELSCLISHWRAFQANMLSSQSWRYLVAQESPSSPWRGHYWYCHLAGLPGHPSPAGLEEPTGGWSYSDSGIQLDCRLPHREDG